MLTRFLPLLLFFTLTTEGARNNMHLGEEDGLTNNYIMDVAQDRNGFVWVSTESGLHRFDGTSFLPFKKGGDASPAANELNRLYADTVANVLWIATQRHGLSRLDCSTYRFTHYDVDPENPDAIGSCGITDVSPASDGKLWVSTYTDGLDLLDPATGKFTHFNSRTVKGWPDDHIWTAEEYDGSVYIGHVTNGFSIFNPSTGSLRNYRHNPDQPSSIAGDEVRTIYPDLNGNIWLGTDRGLSLFNPASGTFTNFRHSAADPGSLISDRIYHITRTSDNRLWISTENGGVSVLDLRDLSTLSPDRISFTNLGPRPGAKFRRDTNEVSNKTVHCVFEDSFGNIWIGTYGDGIDLICHRELPFTRIHTGSVPMSVSADPVMALCASGDSLLVGHDGDGVEILSGSGLPVSFKAENSPLRDNSVLSIFKDSRGNIWIGTYAGGVHLIKAGTHTLTDVSPTSSTDIRCFAETPGGHILAGTGYGIIDYSPGGESFTTIYARDGKINDEWIRSLLVRRDGSVWVGSFGGGVSVYSPTFVKLHYADVGTGLHSNTVNHLSEGPGGFVWAATGDGVARMKTDATVDTIIGTYEGLSDANVRAITHDRAGDIWMSTATGISRLSADGRISNYGHADGIEGADFTGGCVATGEDGRISFGSHFGIYTFLPRASSPTENLPAPTITAITVYTSGKQESETEIFAPQGPLEFPHDRSTLRFTFNILDPALAKAVDYSYRIEGIDSRWYPAGDSGEVIARNVSPGTYVLTVRASLRNRPDIFSETSLEFTVRPPLWATWWAKMIYAILILLAIFFGFRFYKNRLSLEYALDLERKNSHHEQELNAERMRFFTNITHELRTPLTLILGPLDDLRSDKSISSTHARKINVIHKSAERLLNLINTILEFRRTETQNRALSVVRGDVSRIVADLGQRYRELNSNPAITVSTEIEQGDFTIWHDPEIITIIIDNLLSNACKYTVKGNVTLRLYHTVESGVPFTEISVSDSGIGIGEEALRHIFDRYYRDRSAETRMGTGIGLALVYNLVKIHKGEIFAESEPGKGSVFRFRLHTDNNYPLTPRRQEEKGEDRQAAIDDERTEETPAPGRIKVLVVEDNIDIINYVRDALSPIYDVEAATDGAEGLKAVRRDPPDIIVTDIMMPNMDGMTMVRTLKSDPATDHIPIIIVTAKIADDARREAYESGADSFLTKPFSSGLIRSRIKNIIDIRQSLARAAIGCGTAPERDSSATPGHGHTGDEATQVIVSDMGKGDAEFMRKVEEIITANISSETLDVGFIAAGMCMSHSTLYRKVKGISGMTVAGLIRRLRARRAAELLRTGKYTVSEIVYMVGMGSPANFRQCFKAEYGVTPSAYAEGNNN